MSFRQVLPLLLNNVDNTEDLIQLLSSTPFAVQYLRKSEGTLERILSRIKLRPFVDYATLHLPAPSPLELRQIMDINRFPRTRDPNFVLVKHFTLRNLKTLLNDHDELRESSGYWQLRIETLGINEDSLAVLVSDIRDDANMVTSYRFHKIVIYLDDDEHYENDEDDELDYDFEEYQPKHYEPQYYDWIHLGLDSKFNDQIMDAAIEEWKYAIIQDFQKEMSNADPTYHWVMGYR